MTEFRVTMDACIAGNPFKAWKERLPEGEHRVDEFGEPLDPTDLAPDRVPPDDVWQTQTHEFDDLETAKAFVRSLPEKVTTHVTLEWADPAAGDAAVWTPIFVQDAGAEHLDAAAPGVTPPHLVDSELPFEHLDEIPEAPGVMPSQGAAQ